MAYTPFIVPADIETVWGELNVNRWADLDNTEDSAVIEARKEYACKWACQRVESLLRGGRYVIPMTPASGEELPTDLIDNAARLAGYWLYIGRGLAENSSEESGRMKGQRKSVEDWCRQVRNGQVVLDLALLEVATEAVKIPVVGSVIVASHTCALHGPYFDYCYWCSIGE
jgi:hypothetical protein